MLTANDFHRAAAYLLVRYGDDAADRAAARASELGVAGETGLQRIWQVLFATVRELERARAPGDSSGQPG